MHEKKKSAGSSSEPYKIQIECIFDDLSDTQIKEQEKRLKEFNEFKKKFDQYICNKPELNIEKGDLCTFVEFVSAASPTIQAQTAIPVMPVNTPPMQLQNGRVSHPASGTNNQILLVNNQRLGLTGLIVPTSVSLPSSVGTTNVGTPAVSVVNVDGTNVAVSPSVPSVSTISSPKLGVSNQSQLGTPNIMVDAIGGKLLVPSRPGNIPCKRPLEIPTVSIQQPTMAVTSPIIIADKTDLSSGPPAKKRPIYPLPSPTISIDLTEDLSKIGAGGPSGKIYPSLVVTARPCIRNEKEAKSPAIIREKQALDVQVRRVLLLSPQNFTEWLIKTGLLRCDHYCCIHFAEDGSKIKLKLGQYTDSHKFPFSGGYVWVSDCCPQTYITVFSGSIFEVANYPPTTTMKLIYHWACHTTIQNILQWVNVSNLYIKNLFTTLRAVCTAAIHEHYELMGGKGKKVQVGVVSLGTSSKENTSKRVRVDILCLLDPETRIVRIRAVEPTVDPERFVLRKFTRIFEIMPNWVDRDTTILVDNTIERSILYNMGFKSMSQALVKDKKGVDQYPNYEVMDYLRLIVPKMFQNTLSILSRQVIQQFLDELCWRERWGPFPARAFDTVIKHLIEQTKINSGASLLNRLSKISANPFKDWKYAKWRSNCISRPSGSGSKSPGTSTNNTPVGCGGPPQKVTVTSGTQLITLSSILPPPSSVEVAPTETDTLNQVVIVPKNTQTPVALEPAKILLEPYYYGTLAGDESLQNRVFGFSANCVICRKLFTNNIELTDHLIQHGLSVSSSDTRELCKICCKRFPCTFSLLKHQNQIHFDLLNNPKSSQWCLMCNLEFQHLNSLFAHMMRFHGELELPYACKVCSFRTSIFMKMIQHINSAHKSDDVAFCPFCFETVSLYRNGKPSPKNQIKFIYHIQRHQLLSVKKCCKCLTVCLNKTILFEHETEAHKSFSNNDEIERYTTECDTLMPAPLEDPMQVKADRLKLLIGGPYKVVNFPSTLTVNESDSQAICMECNGRISHNHFMAELLCLKCDYSTCCIHAMNEHNQFTHSYNSLRIYNTVPTVSETALHCSCSYTTKDGNAMAYHLVKCNKTTCYSSPRNSDATNVIELTEEEEAAEEERALNCTYTIEPSTSRDINNATFTINK